MVWFVGAGGVDSVRCALAVHAVQSRDGEARAGRRRVPHVCAYPSGGVRCWGRGGSGQLGYGNGNDIGMLAAPSTFPEVNISTESGDGPVCLRGAHVRAA